MKLKWAWLENNSKYYGFYNDLGNRLIWGIFPTFVIFLFNLISWGYIPLWINLATIVLAVLIFAGLTLAGNLPKLYYLDGLTVVQKSAVRWYDSLSLDEQKLLPHEFRSLVVEKGNEYYDGTLNSIAWTLHNKGESLVEKHREAVRLKTVDYRARNQVEFMQRMYTSLEEEIKDRKALEAEIESTYEGIQDL